LEIIAHRGFIAGPVPARKGLLIEALAQGFGVEFDLRDSASGIVLAHDPWELEPETLEGFLSAIPVEGTLAVNIKSCGLASRIKQELASHGVSPERCFFFDMAIPDHVVYLKNGLRAYPRISEIETRGPLAEKAEGIWLDAFHSTWWDCALVADWLHNGVKVCVVSPELHRRERHESWTSLREGGLHRNPGLSLCTDYALEAREFFRE